MVVFCALIAWLGANDLDKFVAVVGSFACVPLTFIYPVSFVSRSNKYSLGAAIGFFPTDICF